MLVAGPDSHAWADRLVVVIQLGHGISLDFVSFFP